MSQRPSATFIVDNSFALYIGRGVERAIHRVLWRWYSVGPQTVLSHPSVHRTSGTAHVVTVAPITFFRTHERKFMTQVVVWSTSLEGRTVYRIQGSIQKVCFDSIIVCDWTSHLLPGTFQHDEVGAAITGVIDYDRRNCF